MGEATVKKVTISLPRELLAYADARAARDEISRSRLIAKLLAQLKQQEEDALAAEGYQFYAHEAEEFAEASRRAVSEAISDAG